MDKLEKQPVKKHIKFLAQEVTEKKKALRVAMQNGTYTILEQWKVDKLREDYRYQHIAYSLLKGRRRNQVERLVNRDNIPVQAIIEKYLNEFSNHFPPNKVAKAQLEVKVPPNIKILAAESLTEEQVKQEEEELSFYGRLKAYCLGLFGLS